MVKNGYLNRLPPDTITRCLDKPQGIFGLIFWEKDVKWSADEILTSSSGQDFKRVVDSGDGKVRIPYNYRNI